MSHIAMTTRQERSDPSAAERANVRGGMVALMVALAGAAVGDETAADKANGWKVGRDRDASVVFVERAAEGIVRDVCFKDRVHKPTLALGCRAGRFSVLIAAGQMPQTNEDRRTQVSLVFDAEAAVDRTATAELGHATLYFEDSLALLPELRAHVRLRVSFPSRCSKAQHLSFSLIGLPAVLEELSAEGCDVGRPAKGVLGGSEGGNRVGGTGPRLGTRVFVEAGREREREGPAHDIPRLLGDRQDREGEESYAAFRIGKVRFSRSRKSMTKGVSSGPSPGVPRGGLMALAEAGSSPRKASTGVETWSP